MNLLGQFLFVSGIYAMKNIDERDDQRSFIYTRPAIVLLVRNFQDYRDWSTNRIEYIHIYIFSCFRIPIR